MTGLDLIIKIMSDLTGMTTGLGSAEDKLKGFKGSVDVIATGIGSALTDMFGAAQIGKAVMGVIVEADKISTAVETLAQKIRNFNPELNKSSADIMAWSEALAKGTKFIDDEVVDALDKAIIKTGDYGAAQKVVSDAVKLATVANIPLNQATEMLGMAYLGNTRGLTALGRQMGINIKDNENYASVMAKVTQGYQGMADVVAGDLSVGMKKLKAETSGYFEDIVIPNIPTMIKGLQFVGDAVKNIVIFFEIAGAKTGAWISMLMTLGQSYFKFVKSLLTKNQADFENSQMQMKAAVTDYNAQVKAAEDDIFKKYYDNSEAKNEKIKKDAAANLAVHNEAIKAQMKLEAEHYKKEQEYQKWKEQNIRDEKALWMSLNATIKQIGATQEQAEAAYRYYFPEKAKVEEAIREAKKYAKTLEEIGLSSEEVSKLVNEKMTEIAQSADWATQMVKEGIANNINSAIDSMVDGLIEGTLSWTEWAENTVKAIEKVILKMLVLKALETGLNALSAGMGSNLLKALGITKSSPVVGGGGGPSEIGGINFEIVTADPSSYVRFRNQAIGKVSAGKQAKYNTQSPSYYTRK